MHRRTLSGMKTDPFVSLLDEHGTGAWCLTVDADEVLVYPRCEKARLPALTASGE